MTSEMTGDSPDLHRQTRRTPGNIRTVLTRRRHMATKAVRHQAKAAAPQKKSDHWQKARDFFGDMGDFLKLFTGPGLSIPQREKKYWATLNERQKAEIRYDLLN
jgi:hypothetical protein